MESWLHELLCLDAAEHIPKLPARLPHPSECELYYINRDTLFSYHTVCAMLPACLKLLGAGCPPHKQGHLSVLTRYAAGNSMMQCTRQANCWHAHVGSLLLCHQPGLCTSLSCTRLRQLHRPHDHAQQDEPQGALGILHYNSKDSWW